MEKDKRIDPENCLGNAGISTRGIFIDPEPLIEKPLSKQEKAMSLPKSGRILAE